MEKNVFEKLGTPEFFCRLSFVSQTCYTFRMEEIVQRKIFWGIAGTLAIAGLAFVAGCLLAVFLVHPKYVWLTDTARPDTKTIREKVVPPQEIKSPPPPPSMERIKREGCIADGLLSSYGHETTNIEMAKRVPCYAFHRAIQTWLEPPDFKRAKTIMEKVNKPGAVWGMMLAEAIHLKADYYFPDEDRQFSFYDMCRPDTRNKWGEHTCIPFTAKKEYRKYLKQVTRDAMDAGIQNFLFGQVWLQDDVSNTKMPEIVAQMRRDAADRGMEIVIGAQTNDIDNPAYLRVFDYVEGGVGLHENGRVEDQPCFSKWWKKDGDWCWALLWNDRFRLNANNVLVHLDWSGKRGDDMSTFARMNAAERADTLRGLHEKFTNRGVGFLLPLMAALPQNNGGCYGEEERFYSASDKFGCKDEGVITDILKNAWK